MTRLTARPAALLATGKIATWDTATGTGAVHCSVCGTVPIRVALLAGGRRHLQKGCQVIVTLHPGDAGGWCASAVDVLA